VIVLVAPTTRLGALGGTSVIVAVPLPVMDLGDESRFSALRSWILLTDKVSAAACSVPRAGLCRLRLTVVLQFVSWLGTESQKLCVTD